MLAVRKKDIDWSRALNKLSPGAYFMLSVLWYKEFNVTDKTIMRKTNDGLSVHKRHKKELKDNGYLRVRHVEGLTYIYIVGEGL